MPQPSVVAVSLSPTHSFSKSNQRVIRVEAGLGVHGDAHSGTTVKHRSRVAADPSAPNKRQVHLIHAELLDELALKGMPVSPGQMGENITTRGLDILSLPRGTELRIGDAARIQITGLRNPCAQLDQLHPGLMAATLDKAPDGSVIRKAGVMGIVIQSGDVRPGDGILVSLPPAPHEPLGPV